MFVIKGRKIYKSITASTDQIGTDEQVMCAVPFMHFGTVFWFCLFGESCDMYPNWS